jgi:capsular exopolysaccharide synthesis family protein
MSRNYELLQKLGKEQDALRPIPADAGSGADSAPSLTGAAAAVALPTPPSEEICALAQQVFLTPGSAAPRTVVLTSTEPGTGCTWVSAHLGEVLAGHVAASVCLVDANLQAPGLHRQFGVENTRGLSDALTQLDPIRVFAQPLSRPNFWLISSGSAMPNPQGILSSDRMRLRLNELRSEFDFILIDTPALNVSNGAAGLGGISDGVLLVLKANASRRETAKQAVDDLQAAKAKVLGAVLNQRTYPIPSSIYGKL